MRDDILGVMTPRELDHIRKPITSLHNQAEVPDQKYFGVIYNHRTENERIDAVLEMWKGRSAQIDDDIREWKHGISVLKSRLQELDPFSNALETMFRTYGVARSVGISSTSVLIVETARATRPRILRSCSPF